MGGDRRELERIVDAAYGHLPLVERLTAAGLTPTECYRVLVGRNARAVAAREAVKMATGTLPVIPSSTLVVSVEKLDLLADMWTEDADRVVEKAGIMARRCAGQLRRVSRGGLPNDDVERDLMDSIAMMRGGD